jgi:hypothetical protein
VRACVCHFFFVPLQPKRQGQVFITKKRIYNEEKNFVVVAMQPFHGMHFVPGDIDVAA